MRRLPPLMLVVLCAAVSGTAEAPTRASAQTDRSAVAIQTRPLSLNPNQRDQRSVGALTYAGGLLLSGKVEGFGSFSGIDVDDDGDFVSQTDAGDLMRGKLVLDDHGQLVGLTDTSFSHLTDEEGRAYPRKEDADAEDITFLPDGGFAVSFEQNHRVQSYHGRGPARRLGVPAASADFSANTGLEALAAWTDPMGRHRLVEGWEGGPAWSCDMEGQSCEPLLTGVPDKDFMLTGLDALPGGRGLVGVYRAFDPIRGVRALIVWIRPDQPHPFTILARLAAPLTVDNMEGVAAVARPDGSIRLYVISDDNFSMLQRSILLAFDWRP